MAELREYIVLEDVPIVAISALNHQNIEHLKKTLQQFITALNRSDTRLHTTAQSPPALMEEKVSSDVQNGVEADCDKTVSLLVADSSEAMFHYIACGTLTNEWSNQKDGQIFHVIVREGVVSVD